MKSVCGGGEIRVKKGQLSLITGIYQAQQKNGDNRKDFKRKVAEYGSMPFSKDPKRGNSLFNVMDPEPICSKLFCLNFFVLNYYKNICLKLLLLSLSKIAFNTNFQNFKN